MTTEQPKSSGAQLFVEIQSLKEMLVDISTALNELKIKNDEIDNRMVQLMCIQNELLESNAKLVVGMNLRNASNVRNTTNTTGPSGKLKTFPESAKLWLVAQYENDPESIISKYSSNGPFAAKVQEIKNENKTKSITSKKILAALGYLIEHDDNLSKKLAIEYSEAKSIFESEAN